MGALILLNGPPAVGKSTIAEILVSHKPLALNLDIDVVRAQLGAWIDQPEQAGLAARRLALVMISEHLAAGHDVVVPQLLARPDFIEQLEQASASAGSVFVEIALTIDRSAAIDAFVARSANPARATHVDAAALVEGVAGERDGAPSTTGDVIVGGIYDQLEELMATRPQVHRVGAVRGQPAETHQAVIDVIAAVGVEW